MDKRELLKSVLQNFINDKPEEAKADFHQYLTLKSKEITGIGTNPATQETTEVKDTQVEPDSTQTTDTSTQQEVDSSVSVDPVEAAAVAAAEDQAQGTE